MNWNWNRALAESHMEFISQFYANEKSIYLLRYSGEGHFKLYTFQIKIHRRLSILFCPREQLHKKKLINS